MANPTSVACVALYLRSGTPVDLEKCWRARLAAERAAKLHHEAAEVLASATKKKAEIDRQLLERAHARDRIVLPEWTKRLEPLHEKLHAIDAALGELVITYARQTLAAMTEWDAADTRARTLGTRLETPRPTLEETLLLASTSAAKARDAAGAEDCGEWLTTPPGHEDWRLENLSAADRASALATAERNRQHDAVVGLANLAAAQVAAHQKTTEGATP